jgi:hypothetical protein
MVPLIEYCWVSRKGVTSPHEWPTRRKIYYFDKVPVKSIPHVINSLGQRRFIPGLLLPPTYITNPPIFSIELIMS